MLVVVSCYNSIYFKRYLSVILWNFQLRLVSVNAICAPAVLRFLRSNHDLIYRLASSQLFVSTDGCAEEEDNKMLINLRRFLQGSVLYLSSMELSSLLKIGHFRFFTNNLMIIHSLKLFFIAVKVFHNSFAISQFELKISVL